MSAEVVWETHRFIQQAGPAATGIVLQEAMHWYKLFGLEGRSRTTELLFNCNYLVGFLVFSVFGTLFIYYYTCGGNYLPKDIVVLGLALPTIIKQLIAGANAHINQHMGNGRAFIRAYFV